MGGELIWIDSACFHPFDQPGWLAKSSTQVAIGFYQCVQPFASLLMWWREIFKRPVTDNFFAGGLKLWDGFYRENANLTFEEHRRAGDSELQTRCAA